MSQDRFGGLSCIFEGPASVRPGDPEHRRRKPPGIRCGAPGVTVPAKAARGDDRPVRLGQNHADQGCRAFGTLDSRRSRPGTSKQAAEKCQPHGPLAGKQRPVPQALCGLAAAIAPALRVPRAARPPGAKAPAGAGLRCACMKGPGAAVVPHRAGKRGAVPDPRGMARRWFAGSGRFSRPASGGDAISAS